MDDNNCKENFAQFCAILRRLPKTRNLFDKYWKKLYDFVRGNVSEKNDISRDSFL
jgi:hypothetical protein